MDAREFAEWQAFYRLEPWGPERTDVGFALLASVMAAGRKRKDGREIGIKDMMPIDWLAVFHERERERAEGPRRQSAKQMEAIARALARRAKPKE